MLKKVAVIFDEIFFKHRAGNFHPESPERLRFIVKRLKERDVNHMIEIFSPDRATKEEILWNHTEGLYNLIKTSSEKGFFQIDGDTAVNEHSFEAACYAVGAQKTGLRLLFEEGLNYVLALVRPPGHHAERDRAMGFCLFNNIALAAYYARNYYGIKRILIVDFDLHHGNGTQKSFYHTDEVLFFSTHQYPYYPGTGNYDEIGTGYGRGYTINVPLKHGCGDDDFIFFYQNLLKPIAFQYKPQLILISAGFDCMVGDPLGDLEVTAKGIVRITEIFKEIAYNFCDGKILFSLEGGYDLNNLSEGIVTIIKKLVEEETKYSSYEVSPSTYALELFRKIKDLLAFKGFWEI
ncbi:histone deacetylase family protein [Thermodesulfobacterium hveragerdense]|uniref:histone deacetylase family protein n=1 Tax=Thermodesulfobacterium hveragerdense TaxID=53424 RepID=UPI00040F610F|nr:histone deacetylase [Thermodesulfobacterium hveragerdense]